jgi:type I restriction-modification system DNA methylase subunit
VCRSGYDYSTVFTDFVDMVLFAHLSLTDNMKHPNLIEKLKTNKLGGIYEDQYMNVVSKYKENRTKPQGQRPADYFAQAWGALQLETKKYAEDILGEIYMTKISHGQHGQYFTPTHITDLMAQLVGTTGQQVSDPACGSGRMFISMNKLRKGMLYVGVDLSAICAKMTTLNMWLFGMDADIYQGDSLSMNMSQVWRIRRGGTMYHSFVKEMPVPQKIQMQRTIFDLEEYRKAA